MTLNSSPILKFYSSSSLQSFLSLTKKIYYDGHMPSKTVISYSARVCMNNAVEFASLLILIFLKLYFEFSINFKFHHFSIIKNIEGKNLRKIQMAKNITRTRIPFTDGQHCFYVVFKFRLLRAHKISSV